MVAITIETYLGDVGVIDISSGMLIQDIKLLIEETIQLRKKCQQLEKTFTMTV